MTSPRIFAVKVSSTSSHRIWAYLVMPVLLVLSAVTPILAGTSTLASATGSSEAPDTGVEGGGALFTPIVGSVPVAPIPFSGSDGKTHVVYELTLTNASRVTATINEIKVVDAATGAVVQTLDQAAVAKATTLVNLTPSNGSLGPSQSGTVFLELEFANATSVPRALSHRILLTMPDSTIVPGFTPAGSRTSPSMVTETLAPVRANYRRVVKLGPPLQRGSGYIAADACCKATRHRRALLPVDGSLTIGERYAVDWEQVDSHGRIYSGSRTDLGSYAIFGKKALAVANGRVVKAVDGLDEQVPGTFPNEIALDQADGNSVIVYLGNGNYALYAHLEPGSLKVRVGDRVKRGAVLGLVGNTGNSIAPHLHFQIMSAPSPSASSGLPYAITSFAVSGQTISTKAFDTAEAEGTPLEFTPVEPPTRHLNQYPMDQSLVTFRGP